MVLEVVVRVRQRGRRLLRVVELVRLRVVGLRLIASVIVVMVVVRPF